ncbi:restriction endonuclease subunit S [Parabacteroides merdae]|jgi:type I restriction enzyme S subunit|uniref:restriction endonuclease subunit S n=2 Tax=Parabacteroides merdae TaxID=46503 RepID=UPI0021667FD1|nr:restriction endonuclease subunit S [Parabacteroides merdae]MCS2331539.1 restriction endonuclease subunit S [Parabacteroides distasonis]MDB8946694.1 restriction endonuclease subunit S [Parabacteroides merdae]MDB8950510.1 restriction endonuclease subunit S [Parabacteroides merdae]MDB8958370.1 restriction endonuclease subunit S [Parabacteroides merdae]
MSQFIEMFGTVENNTHNFPIMTIGEFANCFAGATPSTSHPEYWENGRIRWMSSGEVHKGHVEDTDSRITELGYKSASTRMVPIHSIVIAIAGQGKTRGTVAITEVDLCTNQSLCAIVPDERVNYSYLYHNLQGRYLELRGLSGDVNGRGGLNLKIIQKIPVILPPIEKQQQFASIAQQADKSKFGDFKSQFIEMFGNPLSSKQKNELKRLGQCCIINPRRPNIALCDTDKVSFIPMPAVSEDGYLVDMADEEYGKVKKGFTYFENNDVLFAKITPCMENGKGAIAYGLTNGIGVGSTEFHVLRPINGISSPYWLLTLTRMPIFRERAAKNMSGTGGQKRVSASYLNHFMVGLPAIEEQRRFEAIYRQADKSKSVIQKALVYLNDIQSDELRKIA